MSRIPSTHPEINRNKAEMTEDEKMRRELLEIQMQMDTTTDESLESTRRMVALCEESKEAGIRTLVMLDEQGEQLDRIDEGMNQINQDMKDAEKNLEGLEKCCGLCVLPWKKARNFEKGSEYSAAWKSSTDGKVNTDGPRVTVGDQKGMQGGFITKITNDSREDEMEHNVVEVSAIVSNLRYMAVDMRNEIDSQKQQIESCNQRGLSLGKRVEGANQRANAILQTH